MKTITEEQKSEILEIISKHLDVSPDKIKDDSNLKEFGMDSIDEVELIMEFEKHFNIQISDSDYENIKTVSDFHKCLEGYLN